MKSSKNETVATFYDVCDVFGSKNDQFSTFAFGLKVIQLFKAKMEAFRERKSSKVQNGPFWILSPRWGSRPPAPINVLGDPQLGRIFSGSPPESGEIR